MTSPGASFRSLMPVRASTGEAAAARLARSEMRARASRGLFFKASLFSDPAWDILLELFATEQEGRRVHISAVGLAAKIPQTTSLRWINALQEAGLIERTDDPHDARRSFVRLSSEGMGAMTLYFRNCQERAARTRPWQCGCG